MLKYFLSPTGEKLLVTDCLEKGLLDEYYPRSYLAVCAEERPWTGKPSTTQLINGTRMAYLMVTTDYAIDPDKQAFRFIGTRVHKKLELSAPPETIAEFSLLDDEISGIVDCIEYQTNGSISLLVEVDYKTWGSFKAARALGLGKVKKTRLMVDNKGNPVLYQRDTKTAKKGDQKTETYFEPGEIEPDLVEAEWQLNRYRIVAERILKQRIERMRLFIIVRDGGCQSARQRGITRNTCYIDIKRIDDNLINNYFNKKRKTLIDRLSNYEFEIGHFNFESNISLKRNCPPPCSPIETWNGRRCQGFCPVSEVCQKIGG